MKFSKRLIVTVVLAVFTVTGLTFSAVASTQVGGVQEGSTGYYDYSAQGVRDSQTETEYWCGDTSLHTTDTILEQQYNLSNWTLKTPERTAFEEGDSGTWDSEFTCNPSNAVTGTFVNPVFNGITYNYAMYYVGFTQSSNVNQIGVAFSQDGLNWQKYPLPVIPHSACSCYGYGQPSVQDINGTITIYFEESTPQAAHYEATSTDGIHFSTPQLISSSGLPNTSAAGDPSAVPYWGSVAYSPGNATWYALFNDGWRPSSTTGGVKETADGGCTLYSTSDPINGSWTELDTIDTQLTGYESNFMCGMVRNTDGTISSSFYPSIKILVSTSYPQPAYNASASDLGNSASFNNWQIAWHEWTPGNPLRKLVRVAHLATAQHEVTTGWYDSSYYSPETDKNLGSLYEAPTGAATEPLYSCKLGYSDYFVSTDSGCLGQYKLGLEGYAYPTAGTNELPLYRCEISGVGDFVSTDSNCEGQKTMELLGYSQAS